MTKSLSLFVCAVILLLSSYPAASESFTYANFNNFSGLTLTGAASVQGGTLQLNPDSLYQNGSAFYTQRVSVLQGFTTSFQFQITHGAQYADGLWFEVQNAGLSNGAQHYSNSTNLFDVEFDTFQNVWDPNANHVAFLGCSGNPTPTIGNHNNGCTLAINPNIMSQMADGSVHFASLVYGTGVMSLVLDGQLVLQTPIDLQAQINSQDGKAWVGFNGLTGAYSERNDILAWSFQSASPVPEPGSLVMLWTGLLAGVAAFRRKYIA